MYGLNVLQIYSRVLWPCNTCQLKEVAKLNERRTIPNWVKYGRLNKTRVFTSSRTGSDADIERCIASVIAIAGKIQNILHTHTGVATAKQAV